MHEISFHTSVHSFGLIYSKVRFMTEWEHNCTTTGNLSPESVKLRVVVVEREAKNAREKNGGAKIGPMGRGKPTTFQAAIFPNRLFVCFSRRKLKWKEFVWGLIKAGWSENCSAHLYYSVTILRHPPQSFDSNKSWYRILSEKPAPAGFYKQ